MTNLTPPGYWDGIIHVVTPWKQFGAARPPDPPYYEQPLIWAGSAISPVSLAMPEDGGIILAADAEVQGGVAAGHATLWRGTPSTKVDLHPPGWNYSWVRAISGDRQFGFTRLSSINEDHAAMWSGSSVSYIDMNPPGSTLSRIYATSGDHQGGAAVFGGGGGRAGIWSGTAESFISVHPGSPWTHSWINGMAGTQQVGAARAYPDWPHAALWHGTAASFTDLDPPESFGYSELLGTCGPAQVGYIAPASGVYAGIWFGTRESFHNLAQYLPPGYGASKATTIATDGVNYYVGGYAENALTRDNEAFLWIGPVGCYANCDGSTAAPGLNVADFTCFLRRFAAGDAYANCDASTAAPALNAADFTCFLQRFAAGCP